MKKNYLIIIGGAIGLILLIVGLIFLYLAFAGKGTLEVTVFPDDASYKIAGKSYTGSQRIDLVSGTYKITFTRDYYEPKTVKANVKKDQLLKLNVDLDLSSMFTGQLDFLTGKDSQKVDANSQLQYEKDAKDFASKNPITSVLPMIKDDYRIDYGMYNAANPKEVTVEITIFTESLLVKSEAQIKNSALNDIKDYKIDPSKIKWYEYSRASSL
jgi:hypothetical protein